MEDLIAQIPFDVDWGDFAGRGVRIALILVLAGLAYYMLRGVRKRVAQMEVERDGGADDTLERRKTLATVTTTAGTLFIVGVAALLILDQLGISLGPFLATAGIAGLAIGFGAQTLVKDFISGIFVLAEGQYHLGDVIDTAGVSGTVEQVTLRVTKLRDVHGALHIVPNGEVRVVSNKTTGWARAVLEIGVSYGENPDHVIAVLKTVAQEVYEDSEIGGLLLEEPTVPGVQAFGDSQVVYRMMAKTLPLKQWEVARELRRRIKIKFFDEDIEIPFPQRTIHYRPIPGTTETGPPDA